MPKMKTNKSASKRFKLTKTGKVKRHKAFASHLKTHKSAKRRRNLRKAVILGPEDADNVKRMLPYG
ncbi:MAG: 50S ribosomal protein L35 [Candidatus Hydrogenedentales bacterium]|jgi:large subunit ribosomal protein L35